VPWNDLDRLACARPGLVAERDVQRDTPVRRGLVPRAWIDYRRITLLGLRSAERVTIDLDLEVRRGWRSGCLRDVAVVEVKQATLDRHSGAMVALRAAGWRPGWASKYCIGIARTIPDVRANRLRVGLRALKAIGTWVS
jgi:hypothetical protein